ncbi:alkaline shock response membrane anchor protein AmaP [Amycolatopsis sp. OK19-0408]|uniref:Alkaline shock response membrane anchor protein AmaP n=1 Tax=Amycolatopsis iheyensis TaxID=2945988 RepID=A0A9X2NAE2_9PSEU|nr:alkaline shock response membrane anchor protein AmaP [Amycolatopsis iheyensis]MCR6483573.1 alkaline shock response membrane anchor protein AmaP [Amycolatopsis iheyensis]
MNRPARLNRTLLAGFGLLLIAAGAVPAAIRFHWLPALGADRPIVPGTALPPTWAWYVTATAGVVVALAGLRWLAAQLVRKPAGRTWHFESGTGTTDLATTTAVAPFIEEVRGYPGVRTATASLTGPADHPELLAVVSVEQDGDPAEIRDRIRDEGVSRLCQALDLDDLPTQVELRFTTAAGSRVA